MTKLNHKSRVKILPSNRDSISSWLDVLTSMLAVSESQHLQIRDELEDHLRSRVDDLLIVGKPEPEAIQIAVAELGETAELAKLITHAHTRTNPRRKFMNAALIAVALGGMSFGGYTFINGTTAPSATPSSGGAVPVVVPEETRKNDEKTHKFSIDQRSAKDVLSQIAKAFDRELVLSQDVLNNPFARSLDQNFGEFAGKMTLEQAVEEFQLRPIEGYNGYRFAISDDTLLYESYNEYRRNEIQTRVYPTPQWISGTEQSLFNYAESLKSLLEVKYDLGYTSIQIIGGSIVAAAPPEIHSEIVRFMTDLEATLTQQRAERMREIEVENAKIREAAIKKEAEIKASSERNALEIKRKQEQSAIERKAYQEQQRIEARRVEAEKQAARKQTIERIQAEFNAVRTSLLETKVKINEIMSKQSTLGGYVRDDDPAKKKIDAQKLEIKIILEELRFEHEETEERYLYLRTRLLESQYANLFEGLE
jgi:hypothetical protein